MQASVLTRISSNFSKLGHNSKLSNTNSYTNALFSYNSRADGYGGRSEESKAELEIYLERGKRNAANPTESLLQLENIIKHYSNSTEYEKLLSSNEYFCRGATYEFFIALISPSLTGKTQMAFDIRSKRPLYFTFDKWQDISKNFTELSRELLKAVVEDQDRVLEYLYSIGYFFAEDASKPISLDVIDRNLTEFKFKCLGFLAHLISDAEKNFDGTQKEDDWMRFYTRHEDGVHKYEYSPYPYMDYYAIRKILFHY